MLPSQFETTDSWQLLFQTASKKQNIIFQQTQRNLHNIIQLKCLQARIVIFPKLETNVAVPEAEQPAHITNAIQTNEIVVIFALNASRLTTKIKLHKG